MNPADKESLDQLISRQSEITLQLQTLQQECLLMEKSIDSLLDQSSREETQAATTSSDSPKVHSHKETEKSPLAVSSASSESHAEVTLPSSPPPLPQTATAIVDLLEIDSQVPSHTPDTVEPEKSETHLNWEINFGQTWLVRIGVLSLLTGLIFLSTYAYKNWVYDAPASLKVGFFMLLSLGLTGAGLYFEQSKEKMKLYGRAITAGGLAAGYYTIYAAHFVESLECINSPILAGALLTAWAAIMLAYSCWKQSRIISVMATGLAFYGTIVNPAGWLSLFSALLLSASGMFLLVRYKWNNVGIVTVCTAYIAHAFWLGYYPQELDPVIRITYLASYWSLFACATSRFAGATINLHTARLISSINNSACWALAVFILPSFTERPELGSISLILGSFFLLCGVLASRQFIWKKELSHLYLYKGLFLITIGILVECSGYYRFLILAMEAITLMLVAHRLQNRWFKAISLVVYFFSLGSAVFSNNPPMFSLIALSIISAIYTGITRWSLNAGKNNAGMVALIPSFFTWVILYFGAFKNLDTPSSLSFIVIIAALIWGLFLALKKSLFLRDLAYIASALPLLCGSILSLHYADVANPLGVALPLISLAMWWSARHMTDTHQLIFDQAPCGLWNDISDLMAWSYSFFVSLSIYQLVSFSSHADFIWLYLGGTLAIFSHFLAVITKRVSIAIPAQLFHVCAIFSSHSGHPLVSLLPFLLLILQLFLSEFFWDAKPTTRRFLAPLAVIALCRWTSHPEILLTLLAAGFYALAYVRKDNVLTVTGSLTALFIGSLAGIIEGFYSFEMIDYLPMAGLLVICAFPNRDGEQLSKLWRTMKSGFKFLTLLLLFTYASLHTLESHDGNGLAICWALLAAGIFGLGLFMQHRSYRLIGLLWLAASIIHVVTIDVMALNTLGRILSFITIGLILMGLGYLYNRFQERIMKFL